MKFHIKSRNWVPMENQELWQGWIHIPTRPPLAGAESWLPPVDRASAPQSAIVSTHPCYLFHDPQLSSQL